ncbi:MAG: hypothetical protein H0U90_02455 [Actinobacteria bacterium]|nr:hypothetical protein [Actinomycetota bacterium]
MEATGFRVGATGDFPRVNQPMPGVGIEFENSSAGTVWDSVVTQSFRAGIRADSKKQNVCVAQVNLFENNPNLQNVSVDEEDASCVEDSRRSSNDRRGAVVAPTSGGSGPQNLLYGHAGSGLLVLAYGAALGFRRLRRPVVG